MPYYPVMLQLRGKPCLVVGGGKVAERKITSLLKAEGKVRVVSPVGTERMIQWEEERKIAWTKREFQPQDVKEAILVVAATDEPNVNRLVYDAILPHQWINLVDNSELSTFIVPAVIERGDLQISISTGGKNPGLAKKLKKEWEKCIGPEYEEYVQFLGAIRRRIIDLKLPLEHQKIALTELLNPRFLEWTLEGNLTVRDQFTEEWIKKVSIIKPS